jgi:hypothetical protein
MAKFKVLASFHVDEKGRRYDKDEVIESDDDLDAMFAGKFSRVEEKTRKGRDEKLTKDHNTIPPTVAKKMEDAATRRAAKQAAAPAEEDQVDTEEEIVDSEAEEFAADEPVETGTDAAEPDAEAEGEEPAEEEAAPELPKAKAKAKVKTKPTARKK